MKKRKALLIALACAIVICAVVLSLSGRRPFKDLEPSDVVSASAHLYPPDTEIQAEDIPALVEYLQKVVIYNRDNSYHEYNGQGVTFTLSLSDGSQVSATAFNPFFIIDGVGYKTKYEPCEALDKYANDLLRAAQTSMAGDAQKGADGQERHPA